MQALLRIDDYFRVNLGLGKEGFMELNLAFFHSVVPKQLQELIGESRN
jgi:hypothetical protein